MSFIKNKNKILNYVTIGSVKNMASIFTTKLLVLICEVKNNWEQIIVCHLTNRKLKAKYLKSFIEEYIQFFKTI